MKRRRWKEYLVTVWIIVTLNFILPRIMPGDPFLHLSAEGGEDVAGFSAAQIAYYKKQYAMDDPMWVQYGRYLTKLVRADLGYSIYYNESVVTILLQRLPWTLALVLTAMTASTIIGCLLGSIGAYYRRFWVDRVMFLGMMAWAEMPVFLLGLVLLFLFSAHLNLFPLAGAMTPFAQYPHWGAWAADLLKHAFLPGLTLTLARTPGLYLLARSSMLTVMTRDYLRTARAKGLGSVRIFFRHVLRNAMLPIVTRNFMGLGALLGGAILVENVFGYPGVGLLMQQAVVVHDYPLVQGIFLLVTGSILSANFWADRVYGRLDPRIDRFNSLERSPVSVS